MVGEVIKFSGFGEGGGCGLGCSWLTGCGIGVVSLLVWSFGALAAAAGSRRGRIRSEEQWRTFVPRLVG